MLDAGDIIERGDVEKKTHTKVALMIISIF